MRNGPSARVLVAWFAIRDSLWFIPALATLGAAALAAAAVHLPAAGARIPLVGTFLFAGGGDSARGVLTAIATSLITVTGVVFSVTIVTLQLASSQFTPRVIRAFVAERPNQIVLGIFIGTFTYTLLVLSSIESGADGGSESVPRVAVSISLVLLLISVGALIYFINHSAHSVQAAVIIHKESRQTLARLHGLFPQVIADSSSSGDDESAPPAEEPFAVRAPSAGYIQTVEVKDLLRLAEQHDLVVRMERSIGDFVLTAKTLMSVWPADRARPLEQRLGDCIMLGYERTPEQDVEFGLLVVSDIAVRALSPGTNDPSTAMLCLDRQAEVLAELARRCPRSSVRRGDDGKPRLYGSDISFQRAAGYAFDSIHYYGATHPAILKKMLQLLRELYGMVGGEARAVLARHAQVVIRSARALQSPGADLEAVVAVWDGDEEAAHKPSEITVDTTPGRLGTHSA